MNLANKIEVNFLSMEFQIATFFSGITSNKFLALLRLLTSKTQSGQALHIAHIIFFEECPKRLTIV